MTDKSVPVRSPTYTKTVRSETMCLRMSAELKLAAKAEALRQGRTVSRVLEDWIVRGREANEIGARLDRIEQRIGLVAAERFHIVGDYLARPRGEVLAERYGSIAGNGNVVGQP